MTEEWLKILLSQMFDTVHFFHYIHFSLIRVFEMFTHTLSQWKKQKIFGWEFFFHLFYLIAYPPSTVSSIILSSQPKCVYNCVFFSFFYSNYRGKKNEIEKVKRRKKCGVFHVLEWKSFKLKETKYVLMLSFWESPNDRQFTHIKPKNKINLKYSEWYAIPRSSDGMEMNVWIFGMIWLIFSAFVTRNISRTK